MKNQNIALGASLIILSELALLATGMIIKTVSSEISTEQIVFIRNFFGLLILVPWLIRKGISRLETQHIGLHISPGVVGVTAMVCLFYAWGHMRLNHRPLLLKLNLASIILCFLHIAGYSELKFGILI